MRKMILAMSALTLTVPAMPTAAAAAAPGYSSASYGHSYKARSWRGRDGRIYCKKRNGTTGLIVGGAGGALLGREIDKHGDRTTGTVLGAAVGALLGRHVERNVMSRRCR